MPRDIKKIKPVKVNHHDIDAKGRELQPILYSNTLLIARKRSGKTTLLYHCIKHMIDERSKLIVFCATHNKDDVWLAIKKYLKRRKIQSEFYYNLDDFTDIIARIEQQEDIEKAEEENVNTHRLVPLQIPLVRHPELPDPLDDEEKIKLPEDFPAVPRYMIIMDDIGLNEARNHIFFLAKKNRHLKCKFFVSLQDSLQIKPSVLMQFDYLYLFKGLESDYIKRLHGNVSMGITLDVFEKLYRLVTSMDHMFLNIHLATNEFFMNFEKIEPAQEDEQE